MRHDEESAKKRNFGNRAARDTAANASRRPASDCPKTPDVNEIRCRSVQREDARRGIVIAGKGGKEENGEKERKAASGVR